jgi:Inner membrane protein YgaP-like, transmembrane domain
MRFVQFMGRPAGRVARVVAGAALITGAVFIGGPAGWAAGVVGLVPLAAGAGNLCLFAPLFHAPLRGRSGTS